MNKKNPFKIPSLLLTVTLIFICTACQVVAFELIDYHNTTQDETADRINDEIDAAANAEAPNPDNNDDAEHTHVSEEVDETALSLPSEGITPPGPQTEAQASPQPVASPSAGRQSSIRDMVSETMLTSAIKPTPTAAPAPTAAPSPTAAPADESFPYAPFPFSFTATDIYGNTITEASLGEKQLYFIHHWATWCDVCVRGMPALSTVAEAYGDRVGFIGLVDDYRTKLSKAKSIAESSGVPSSFIMLDAQDEELRDVLTLVQSGYFPTSVIIDASGEVFEPKLIGSYGERYASLLDILLE